jgi:AraC-like DNA-binding protein
VYRWSTDEVEPHNRFDYWREARAKGLFGVTAELDRERRAEFSGELKLRRIGGAGLVELRASPYRVERSKADIANAPGDSICIYQQLGDGGWFEGVPSGDFAIANGRFATSHTDLPYRTAPLGVNGFHLRILKIPVDAVAAPTNPIRSLAPRTFSDDALMPLVQSCFSDLIAADGADEPARTAPLVEALGQLALIERGLIKPASRQAQRGLRIGRLSLARRLIARRLEDPNLSPGMVAGLIGVSVRHMHMLFESAEKSFSQTVTEERLRTSSRLLVEAPERLIADIAYSCGFESLATFYRVFNAAYGMAPGDFRSRAALPH